MSSPSPSSNRIHLTALLILELIVLGPPIAAVLLFTPFITHNSWITVLFVVIYEGIIFIIPGKVIRDNIRGQRPVPLEKETNDAINFA